MGRCGRVLAAVTALAAGTAPGWARPAGGGGCCGDPDAGNCCVADGTPCCDDAACCNAVCSVDPFCCDTAWDSICVEETCDLCGSVDCCFPQCGAGSPPACGPGAGSCFIAHGTPGCDGCGCCTLICGVNPSCCDTAWDATCAGEASNLCGDSCEPLLCPPGALVEPESCGADINGGCNSSPPAFTPAACGQTWCGTAWATGNARDTDWYLFNHSGGTVNAHLVSALPCQVLFVDGIATCSPVVAGQIGCGDNGVSIADAHAGLPAGQYALFIATGACGGNAIYHGFPCGQCNDYVVTLTCNVSCQDDGDCPPGQLCQNGACIIPAPPNDLCENAVSLILPSGGSTSVAGTNINAGNDGAPACGNALPQVGPGAWYRVIGNGHPITATTCIGTTFDSMMSVFCGDVCGGGGACVTGNDDACGLASTVQWCAKAGAEYFILVHGYAAATGNFTLIASDTDISCTPAVDCPLSCFSVTSELTTCLGNSGSFNYHVVGVNTCTGSPLALDFVGSGGQQGEPMCFTVSLGDNNGVPCCTATLCTAVPDCTPPSEPCDLDGDHAIGVTDMLILLAAWNSNPAGPPDYDADGTVAVPDLLYLLASWGPC